MSLEAEMQWKAAFFLWKAGSTTMRIACQVLPAREMQTWFRKLLSTVAALTKGVDDVAVRSLVTFALSSMLHGAVHAATAASWLADCAEPLAAASGCCAARLLQQDAQQMSLPIPEAVAPHLRPGVRVTTAGDATYLAAVQLAATAIACMKSKCTFPDMVTPAASTLNALGSLMVCPAGLVARYALQQLPADELAADTWDLTCFDAARAVGMLVSMLLTAHQEPRQVPEPTLMQVVCQAPWALMAVAKHDRSFALRVIKIDARREEVDASARMRELDQLDDAVQLCQQIIASVPAWRAELAQQEHSCGIFDALLTACEAVPSRQLQPKALSLLQHTCQLCSQLLQSGQPGEASFAPLVVSASAWQQRTADLPSYLRRHTPRSIAQRCCAALAQVLNRDSGCSMHANVSGVESTTSRHATASQIVLLPLCAAGGRCGKIRQCWCCCARCSIC